MVQHLIVPVDGSDASWRVVDVAVALARRCDASVDVIEVVFDHRDSTDAVGRLADHGEPGVNILVWGREAFEPWSGAFPARQTREASEAITRRHGASRGLERDDVRLIHRDCPVKFLGEERRAARAECGVNDPPDRLGPAGGRADPTLPCKRRDAPEGLHRATPSGRASFGAWRRREPKSLGVAGAMPRSAPRSSPCTKIRSVTMGQPNVIPL